MSHHYPHPFTRCLLALFAGALLAVQLSAWASPPLFLAQAPHRHTGEKPIYWEDLGKRERRLLREHAVEWPEYPNTRRHQLLHGARRYMGLSKQQKLDLRYRAKHFKHLSQDDRRRLCRGFYHEHGYLPPRCNQR